MGYNTHAPEFLNLKIGLFIVSVYWKPLNICKTAINLDLEADPLRQCFATLSSGTPPPRQSTFLLPHNSW